MNAYEPSSSVGRRSVGIMAVVLGSALLTACSRSSGDCEAGDDDSDGADVKSALSALASAVDDLLSNIARFDTDDWKEVVPDVKSNAGNIEDAFSKLKNVIG